MVRPEPFGRALAASASAVGRRGRSTTGEKTMLDALVPGAQAWLATGDGSFLACATAAARAADVGRAATATLVATKGRASYLGERSRGHVDPGALLGASSSRRSPTRSLSSVPARAAAGSRARTRRRCTPPRAALRRACGAGHGSQSAATAPRSDIPLPSRAKQLVVAHEVAGAFDEADEQGELGGRQCHLGPGQPGAVRIPIDRPARDSEAGRVRLVSSRERAAAPHRSGP